jgi:hypothetical protein
MVLWNLLDGATSHSGPLLRSFKFMQGGILGTNPRQNLVKFSLCLQLI